MDQKQKMTKPSYTPHPAFRNLYEAYTGADSIGLHLTRQMVELTRHDPLLVVTGSDYVLFPGTGKRPIVEGFRNSTRGFVELTAISHLGPAIAWIFRLRELGHVEWRKDAERLIERTKKVREFNSEAYWVNEVAVEAWTGYESKIADLVDYSCAVTLAFLSGCLADESGMTFENLREAFLDPVGRYEVPIPINDMMVATFALTFLDIGHRIIRWLQSCDFDWRKVMVLVSGRAGRPTAGLTWATNSNCHLLWRASGGQLAVENLHIAAHGPSFSAADVRDPALMTELENQFRDIFLHLRANIDLARRMFEGYPAFLKSIEEPPVIEPATRALHAMPKLRSPDDRQTAITRLRFVMEDPTQQLANSVAHFIIDQLCDHDNRPEAVVIPGFTNMTYSASKRS
jgi:uncharacterized protein DUF5624